MEDNHRETIKGIRILSIAIMEVLGVLIVLFSDEPTLNYLVIYSLTLLQGVTSGIWLTAEVMYHEVK